MRFAVTFAAGALTLMAAFPAAAQEFKPTPNLFGQKAPAPKPPKIDWNRRPSAGPDAPATPTIVCGMTMIPADPKIDPKMKVAPPDRGVVFTMRTVQPSICKTP
jgi:hypothetical protein